MLNIYELEIYVKDFHEARMQSREAELRRLLSQIEPEQRTRMKFRLPKWVGAWRRSKRAENPLQECPEIA
jgi:hypothetical protein